MHSKALLLLGLEYHGKKKPVDVLPHPLHDGDDARVNSDGAPLFNPRWNSGPNHPINKAYIDTIVNLLIAEEGENAQVSSILCDMT